MPEQPAGVPPYTAAMLRSEVEGVLGQWLDDYTEPTYEEYAAGHPQRRIRTGRPIGVNGVPGSFTMEVTVRGEGEPEQRYKLAVEVQRVMPARSQLYRLEGYDTFSSESYPLGNIGPGDPYRPHYDSYGAAMADAQLRLQELNRTQPSAGGQGGIQDQVFIVHPDGRRERVQ